MTANITPPKNPDKRPVALVTGSARRIGAGIIRALADDGYAVAIHCRHSTSDAELLSNDITAKSGAAAVVVGDLADATALDAILDETAAALGPISVLVNNASAFELDHGAPLDIALFDQAIAVNLRAPLYLTGRVAERLKSGAQACVINILDQKVYNLNVDFFSYTVSRLALERATLLQAMALAPAMRVNGIAPGLTLPEASQGEDHFQALHAKMPLGRGNKVEDIVAAIRYLIAAPSVTGEIITVDGGQRLKPVERDTLFQLT